MLEKTENNEVNENTYFGQGVSPFQCLSQSLKYL